MHVWRRTQTSTSTKKRRIKEKFRAWATAQPDQYVDKKNDDDDEQKAADSEASASDNDASEAESKGSTTSAVLSDESEEN